MGILLDMKTTTTVAEDASDLIIEYAAECSMGVIGPRDALARIEARLGRKLTPSERAQWNDERGPTEDDARECVARIEADLGRELTQAERAQWGLEIGEAS